MRVISPRLRSSLALVLALWAGFAIAASGQDVEVVGVKFNAVRAPNGAPGNWLEADVTLNARVAGGGAGATVPRVRVAVLFGFELPAPPGGERRLEHYRADAECVALEPGRANVRFYLPPEIVRRDQLHGDPKYWGVELSVAGKPVAAARTAYAPALGTPEQRKAFQAKAGPLAAANDGVLQPQYLTPFALEYPRATPSFVRRDPR